MISSPVNQLLLSGTTKLTTEASLLDGTEEAWQIKYFIAISERTGLKCRHFTQNSMGFDFLSISGWFTYCLSSLGTQPELETSALFVLRDKSFSCIHQIDDSLGSSAA